MKDVFTNIYKTNFWKSDESVSGQGSSLDQTAAIRLVLPQVFHELRIKSLLDIPCGDYHWFQEMHLSLDYFGADIVPEIITENQDLFPGVHFEVADAMTDDLQQVDLIFCRDMLGHFSNADVMRTLKNFRASGSTYLIATTFPGRNPNVDIETGQWRPIDLEAMRYGLGPSGLLINENCTEAEGRYADKSLGLWKLQRA